MPADVRSTEARIARLEACFGRIDERLNSETDWRKDWKIEIERRLTELNGHAQRAEQERDHFLSKDTYEMRHAELATSAVRLGERIDLAMGQHERDDLLRHKDDDIRITTVENFMLAEKASVETRREATSRSRWVFGAIVTIANLILYLFLHFAIGVK